jgi:hypothetical protein
MPSPASQVNEKLDRIRQRVVLDVPVGVAIAIELGGSIPKWAARKSEQLEKEGQEVITRTDASMTINAVRKPSPRVVAAVAVDLDCTETEVLELLAEGAKQRALGVVVGVGEVA